MGLLLLQMGLLLLGLRRAQACSEAAPATARTQREVYVVTRTVPRLLNRLSGACACVHIARTLQMPPRRLLASEVVRWNSNY